MDAPRTRVQRRPVHGVLLLDKPLGLSSNQALQKAKWLLCAEKAGHTGTLDPLATGVLPLCFGAATKFSQQHLDAHKRYHAVLRLGQATATGDAEGDVIATATVPDLTQTDLDAATLRMTGKQQQVPPMYSALKKDGKALYEYARAGEDVEREPRSIEIFELKTAFSHDEEGFLAISIDALCSKGTYIRTLGEDIAKALGTVGHLRSLRRTQTGHFTQEQCITLQELEAMNPDQRAQRLHGVDVLLADHTPVILDSDNSARFSSGMRRRTALPDTAAVSVYGPTAHVLLGSAYIVGGELIPQRLLNPQDIEQIQRQSAPTPNTVA
ncbi:MAG: tRNA pseudouridine(55) synthase TruB [Burkholderiales bacterium]|nr:tRNA pseudouridine(55) synthase TruB [Burkholderiales bacterium]